MPRSVKDLSNFSGETNENEHIIQRMAPNPQETRKHFMSPTISASLKTNVPRKNVLAERNENLENPENPESNFSKTHIQKPPILDAANPLSPCNSFSDGSLSKHGFPSPKMLDEAQDSDSRDQSSSKPYDPLTNYLSPRPKFLRYNPNRRREIFLRRVQEINESKDGLDSVRSSSVSLSHDVDHEDDDVEEDEETERKCLRLNEVLKCFLLLAVVVISAFCIVHMSSPEISSTSLETMWGFGDWYIKMQNHTDFAVSVKKFKLGSDFFVQIEGKELGFKEGSEIGFDEHFGGELDIDRAIDRIAKNNHEMGKESEAYLNSDPMGCNFEFVELQAQTEPEHTENQQVPLMSSLALDPGIFIDSGWVQEVDFDVANKPVESMNLGSILENEHIEKKEFIVVEEGTKNEDEVDEGFDKEEEQSEVDFDREDQECENERVESEGLESETKMGVMENLIKHLEKQSIGKTAIRISVLSAIVALVMLGVQRKHKKASAIAKPHSSKISVNEANQDHPNKYSPLKHVSEMSPQKSDRILPPTVKLLGEYEYVVGEARSTFSQMVEGEESMHDISEERRSLRKTPPVTSFTRMPHTELSITASPSYGNFSAKEEIAMKREGSIGEAKKAVITPVRRSNRIRSRAQSP
ncbi:hypothetical protein RJ641_019928 [Dillenia turbinata]|uniref:Uncharacterized protein n=1 Tax=Dillenia turbinata TaxID=194707 RepID=A0AAN8UN30_9MAGN